METIRSEISQKDWTAREWTNVRRLKLEELLNKVAECENYLERLWRAAFSGTPVVDNREYADELNSLATLYFREMEKAVGAYVLIYRNFVVKTTELSLAYMKAGADMTARDVAADKYKSEVNTLFPEKIRARSAIDNAARSLIEQIMGVKT